MPVSPQAHLKPSFALRAACVTQSPVSPVAAGVSSWVSLLHTKGDFVRYAKRALAAGLIALLLAWQGPAQPALGAPPAGVASAAPTVMAQAPVEVPEPVTIILFGTGLAALAAAATVKRKR